ncbi:MAG: anion permease [Firmicutes bacterium]|nr:anion permease [Bacillota bacterium]
MIRIMEFIIKDKVFLVAMIFAVFSMFITTPSLAYLDYVNWKVLIIMFTIMIAVSGIYETHFFDYVATKLVMHLKNIKWVGLVIVLVTFFLAMLLTNDAVLLTLIPFTIFITKHTHQEKHAITILILQTIAANMGSALTPMGDPQNIYLYAYFNIPFSSFLSVTFPITLMGLLLIVTTLLIRIPSSTCELNITTPVVDLRRLFLYLLILINALLNILRIVPELYTLIITLILVMIYGRHLLRRVDFHLLLTFLAFFIFTGNLSQIQNVQIFVSQLLNTRYSIFFSGLFVSQLISNVPTAVLLSTFTPVYLWQPLLQGVNIGAMGSIIASLASLITFKYVLRDYHQQIKHYLIQYTILCIIFIIIISTVVLIFF